MVSLQLFHWPLPPRESLQHSWTTASWRYSSTPSKKGTKKFFEKSEPKYKKYTLQGINISHLGKRKIIFKMPFLGNMSVSWRVSISWTVQDIPTTPLTANLGRKKNGRRQWNRSNRIRGIAGIALKPLIPPKSWVPTIGCFFQIGRVDKICQSGPCRKW